MESQSVEYKQNWHDDYLKVVVAFANTSGGTLFIGIDDDGLVCGVENVDKLLEILPNKILNLLDIHIGIYIREQDNLQFIEIRVEKSPFPVSYHGRFYIRNGSTVQELKGNALQQFLLSAQNTTWDEMICPEMTWEDIDRNSVNIFVRRAIMTNRLPANIDQNNIRELFEKLELSRKEQLTRAATLLFSLKPTHYVFMAVCKIGRFRGTSSVDLITDDVIECPLFLMPDKIMELLRAKYLQKNFTYRGLQRIETLEYPELALREAVLNAVVHRNYNGNSFFTVKVFDNALEIWNEGELMSPLTVESLKTNHLSRLRNRKIADIFYRSGAIENWGRGTLNMLDIAKEGGYPLPVFAEFMGGLAVRFQRMIFKDMPNDLTDDINNVTDDTNDTNNQNNVTNNDTNDTNNQNNDTNNVIDDINDVTDDTNNQNNVTNNVIDNINNVSNNVTDDANNQNNDTNNVIDNINNDTNNVTGKRISLIIDILQSDKKISTAEIAKKLNVSKRTILRDIEKMKGVGLVERIGTTKGGYWKIII
ncbi:MAG: putative DNA binding domain-containing protein [Prevotellaceae bacterium]|nr:putative DNA binding domain-containing protein [Prevotellaceae bacterium]